MAYMIYYIWHTLWEPRKGDEVEAQEEDEGSHAADAARRR